MTADSQRRYEKQRGNIRQAASVLDEIKTSAGCADCGFNSWPEALHFDHTDPDTKRHELGWFKDRSKLSTPTRLKAYLDHVDQYCVIRCGNCHARRSKLESHHLVRREPWTGIR